MYVSVREYKRRYPKTTLSSGIIISEIRVASKIVEEYCNTKFIPTSDCYDVDFERKFYTINAPLIKVDSLRIDKFRLKENKGFYVYPEKRIVEIDEDIKEPRKLKKAVTIEYIYGHETVPYIVKEVILDLINTNELISSGKLLNTSYQSETWDADYTYTKAAGEENSVEAVRNRIMSRLDLYKVPDISYLELLDFDNEKGNVRGMLL